MLAAGFGAPAHGPRSHPFAVGSLAPPSPAPLRQRRAGRARSNAAQVRDPPAAEDAAVQDTAPDAEALRKYFSILPPFFARTTTLEELAPGLWGLVQPLRPPGQADIRLRMTAARLDNGDLLLVGPVAPTGEVLAQLASLGGRVAHIVVPNTSPEHFLFAPALAKAFPSATLWTVPGFYSGAGVPLPGRSWLFSAARARNPCATLGDPLPADLEGQLEAVLLDVPFFAEAALLLPRHRALLLADTAVCLGADDPEYASMAQRGVEMARQMGVYGRLGPITRVVFERYPEQGRAWVAAVQARAAAYDVVVPAHGSAPVEDGPAAFDQCFDFLAEAAAPL